MRMDIDQHVRELLKAMGEGVYEKEHILAMSLLSAVAGESIFLLGPPGTAKSLVARRLKMIFKDGRAFEYLMSRFSTPDEIFGPVSISLLKSEDRYERGIYQNGRIEGVKTLKSTVSSASPRTELSPPQPPCTALYPRRKSASHWGLVLT